MLKLPAASRNRVRYAFVVDLRKCIGCDTCSVDCKIENDVPLGVWRTWVKKVEKRRKDGLHRFYVPVLCNNCEKPMCVTVCPTGATYARPDGIVTIDPHRCIGCRYCMAACPYDVRYVDPLLNIVQKCNWCEHRVDAGLLPSCVEACPMGALWFGDMNDPQSIVSKLISENPVAVMKPEKDTGPHVFYIRADRQVLEARGGAPWKRE